MTSPDQSGSIKKILQSLGDDLKLIRIQLDSIKESTPPEYLSIKSAARRFDLTDVAVRSMIKRREVSYYKLGSRVRLEAKEFKRMLIKYPSVDEISIFK